MWSRSHWRIWQRAAGPVHGRRHIDVEPAGGQFLQVPGRSTIGGRFLASGKGSITVTHGSVKAGKTMVSGNLM